MHYREAFLRAKVVTSAGQCIKPTYDHRWLSISMIRPRGKVLTGSTNIAAPQAHTATPTVNIPTGRLALCRPKSLRRSLSVSGQGLSGNRLLSNFCGFFWIPIIRTAPLKHHYEQFAVKGRAMKGYTLSSSMQYLHNFCRDFGTKFM